ncbi:hypothetical protein EDC94DRAFT_493362, partial [Helicostylum pulchrum]
IQNSRCPMILSSLGPYVEFSVELETLLNSDFPCRQHLLCIVPDLFIGCIIQGKNFAVLVTTIEVYFRDANIDERLESNRSTFP